MKWILAALLLIFLGAVGIFAVQNDQPITISFLNWSVASSLALVVVASYVLGMLSGWTVVSFLTRALKGVRERRRKDKDGG
jgi:lipopolysaccharide assembly protein A